MAQVSSPVRRALYPARSGPDLVTLLRQRAAFAPDACAYVFLADGECQEQRLSHGELDARARVIAARLQALDVSGERALLLYPPGLDYISAFFGCLYAGVVAVPAYPPSRHHLHRLKAIVHDATPAVVLTTAEWRERLLESYEESWGRDGLKWLATDTPVGDGTAPWVPPAAGPDSLAFLQYTSGSTGNPKGVMVSHGNLMANQRAIEEAFGHTAETIVVGWLPLYHDMGLIGNILQPLYLGSTAILMSPLAFLEQPARWLKAISKYRAATSGGPNFAYELCARKVTAEQKRGLDLSGWTLAFNGSEPVRASTMERFADAFAPCGFRREAFFPCYGLAEATLFVTGRRFATGQNVGCAARTELAAAHDRQPLVNCGHTWTDHAVRIVDPKTQTPCPDGQEGEIWVSGPSVAQGYWNRMEESEQTFRATLEAIDPRLQATGVESIAYSLKSEASESFLRTGDLGILERGDLFVTGRIKDLIILRGRNYYPRDLEQALDDGVAGLRPGCSAAFSVEQDGEEALVVVAELRREALRERDAQAILTAMRQALAEVCDGPVGDLVAVPPGSVPKTSSGKIRRRACKEAYLAGQLKILARSGETEASPPTLNRAEDSATHLLRDALHALSPAQRTPLVTRFLLSRLAQLLPVPEASLAADTALRSLGLDSLKAVELKHAVDTLLGTEAPVSLFLGNWTVAELAEALAESRLEVADRWPEPQGEQTSFTSSLQSQACGLSYTQQAIWAVHHREPDSPLYNLQVALRVEGELDVQVFEQALRLLLERHDMLRSVYRTEGDGVLQKVLPVQDLQDWFSAIKAMEWSESDLQQDLIRQGTAPFDLAFGPVLRIAIYHQGPGKHSLLFCVHHIAVDLWSVILLLEELRELYEAVAAGRPVKPIARRTGYHEFARWQRTYADSAKGASAWEYWRDHLAGALPVLALPIDYSRSANPNYRGSSCALHVRPELAGGLRTVGAAHGATIFATLLAAYSVLLHRYTHQGDIIIGTASSGRSRAEFAEIIGNCVNPLAIRTFPAGGETFATHLHKVKGTLLDALEHQDLPFSVLIERLQPGRASGHWPIFQTLVVFRTEQSGIGEGLAGVTLGEQSAKVGWGDWTIEPINLLERGETFDLTLTVAALGEGFLASFHYRSDLFAPETIARMAGHFEMLLEGIVENDERQLSELSLLRPAERQQLLIDWNSSQVVHPPEHCLHRLFEIQAQKTPGVEAVVWENERLTYAELNAEANRLAHHLRSRGVGPETRGVKIFFNDNRSIGYERKCLEERALRGRYGFL